MQAPIVTSITSVYNGEAWLKQAIDCLLNQTTPVNVLVIDSGSNDGTYDICVDFGHQIQYVRTSLEPLYVSWNHALRLIDTPYAVINNADDWMEPNAVETELTTIKNNDGVVLVYSDYIKHTESGEAELVNLPEYSFSTFRIKCYVGTIPLFVVSKLIEAGGFNETMVVSGDWDAWCRLAQLGKFIRVPQALSHYRLRKDGIEHKNRGKQIEEDNLIRNRYRSLS